MRPENRDALHDVIAPSSSGTRTPSIGFLIIHMRAAVTEIAGRSGVKGAPVAHLVSQASMLLSIATILGCIVLPPIAAKGTSSKAWAAPPTARAREARRWRSTPTCVTWSRGHGRRPRQGHHHLRHHGFYSHPHDVTTLAHHTRRNCSASHRSRTSGSCHCSPSCPRPPKLM